MGTSFPGDASKEANKDHEIQRSDFPDTPVRNEMFENFSDPPTRRSSSTRRLDLSPFSTTASQPLERVNTSVSNFLSLMGFRALERQFTHGLEKEKTAADVIVDFEGNDDPYQPINWPFKKKAMATTIYGLTTMSTTLASSIYSPATSYVAREYHIGDEVSILGTSLFLLGLGFGPLIWAPLSEVYGRKPAVLIPLFIAAIFAFGAGAGKDIQTIVICRFFQGFFGSAPVTNTGGVLSDIWSPADRAAALVAYSMALVGGPTLGPLIGGAICTSYLSWRWTQYLTGILMAFITLLGALLVEESHPGSLLVTKARRLRHNTGNWALHAKHEEWDVSLSELMHRYMVRPIQILSSPICFLMALYASFCYGILYASLGAFAYEFEVVRGWNEVVGALPFLAILLGVVLGGLGNLANQKYYLKRWHANNNSPVPEARLVPMMFGSVLFAAGLFIFAWTSDANIPWIAPCLGILCMGTGFITIFQGSINYLIDTFQRYSASAVAANTFMRSCFAAAFPLFITYVLEQLGVSWGVSIFAIMAAAMVPIPYLFFVFGERIRARGSWSRESTL